MELPTKYKIKNIQKLIKLLVWELKELSNDGLCLNFSIELVNPSTLEVEGEIESDELKLEFFDSEPETVYRQIEGLEFLSFDRAAFSKELPFFLNQPDPYKLIFHAYNLKVGKDVSLQKDRLKFDEEYPIEETCAAITFVSNRKKSSPLFEFSCEEIDNGAVFAANLYYTITKAYIL